MLIIKNVDLVVGLIKNLINFVSKNFNQKVSSKIIKLYIRRPDLPFESSNQNGFFKILKNKIYLQQNVALSSQCFINMN